MFALGPEEKTVQPLVLAHRVETLETSSKHFVDIALMADVEDEFVLRRLEDTVERDGEFDDAEIRPEMSAGLGKHLNQLLTHFLGKLRQAFLRQGLDVVGRMDPVEQAFRFGGGHRRD